VHASVVETGQLGWADIARVLSSTPARIGRLSGQGQGIITGAPAELTLYDPSVSRVFGRSDLSGKSVNSPYLTMTLPGQVQATFHRGYATVLDGAVRAADLVAAAAAAATLAEAGR
jgi:dihydroorotase